MSKKAVERGIEGQSSVTAAAEIEKNTQWTKYKGPNGGHGFAAEDANALNDKWRGKKVDKVGLSNELNGADRIVDGKMIQTKYYDTAQRSVDAAFDKVTGNYKYNGQILEVPKDQYEAALERMKEKIAEGKVPGYTDPEKAGELVKRGDVTYQQARNIAKAGNIDSLWFDVKNQAVVSGCSFGISFVIIYAAGIWNGLPAKKAFINAFGSALKTGTIVLLSGVGTRQLLRTSFGRSFAAFTTKISRQAVTKIYGTKAGKEIIEKVASAIMKKALYGVAAKNVISKILRSNVVTSAVTSVAVILPDAYKAIISEHISYTQFGKNLAVALGGVGGGTLGGMAGAAAGTFLCPGPGTACGLVLGSLLAGSGISIGVKKILDLITPDDAKIMIESMNKAIEKLSIEYMVTEDELEKIIIPQVQDTVNSKWLENMYRYSGGRKHIRLQKLYVRDRMECYFKAVLKKRTKIITPNPNTFKWLAFTTKLRLLAACILKDLRYKSDRVARTLRLQGKPIHKKKRSVYASCH